MTVPSAPVMLRSAGEVRSFVRDLDREGRPLCFVPTMGDLHEGHLGLVRIGLSLGPTVVSIFVNPTQFAPGEDYDRYPRRLEDDRERLAALGVEAVYAPPVEDLYPEGEQTRVEVRGLTEPLCGQHREGHFLGVTTICTKLFNVVTPDVAIFGQKDAQQCLVIDRLIRDLHLPVELCVGPTGRAEDGVALSSRNRYLSDEQRPQARALAAALDAAQAVLEKGERDVGALEERLHERLRDFPVDVDYADVRRVPDLSRPGRAAGRTLIAVAATVGRARLLDNRCFEVGEDSVAIAPLLDHATPEAVGRRWASD